MVELMKTNPTPPSKPTTTAPTATTTPTIGLGDEQIDKVKKVYGVVMEKFNHAQINMLTSMLVSLSREWEVREKIEQINIDLATQNKKCGWKKDYVSISLLPVPQLPKRGGK